MYTEEVVRLCRTEHIKHIAKSKDPRDRQVALSWLISCPNCSAQNWYDNDVFNEEFTTMMNNVKKSALTKDSSP